MLIRKDDMVVVITGDDADPGKQRRVLRVLRDKGKVVVEGVNRVYKHLKPNRRNAQGGRLSKEMPIDVSNVQLYCPSCRRGVRVGRRYAPDGHKERYCKKCGAEMPGRPLSKPRKAYAQTRS
ncbi:MAG: 50S ribosomal protein L24 [Gemmataceae bacterium]|nr:50S ribosomal protein L24 [Gemmataceae bacterium]MDW8264476.1 50S ribosomal protein L24 [Gemmataceae bacterium]